MTPADKRESDSRRLTRLKVGTVAVTVAGLGVFAGLAAAGTDDTATTTPADPTTPGASWSASDAARAAESDSFFDEQAQGGAVGGYADDGYGDDDYGYGYGRDGDGGHHRHRDRHGPPPASADMGGYGGSGLGSSGAMPQSGMAPGTGMGPSQGSTGGS